MTVAAPISDFRYLSTYIVKRTSSAVDPSWNQQTQARTQTQTQTRTGWYPSSGKSIIDRSILLQDRECDLEFYETYFSGRNHLNYVTAVSPQGPIVVSIVVDQKRCVRILVRTAQGSERIEHPMSALSIPWFKKLFGVPYLLILNQICPSLPIHTLELCQHPRLPQELIHMEERQIIRSYKFGIYQLLPGQTLEQEGLANPCDSCTPAFMDFVHWLGEPVRLRNWKGYRAGLDVIGDTTGEKSIFTNWNGYQIMFHCAPFMPFNSNDQQQVERRRFIGNDIVVIIFKESDNEDDRPFDLCSVGSRQNHIICIVRPIYNSDSSSTTQSYRVSIAVKDGIRNFSPVDFPAVLQRDDSSRDLLLLKLICGERAAYRAKAFATQLLRTRESLLRDVIETYR